MIIHYKFFLLNVQQQLDKLGMLATHEPASPSPVMSSSIHIQNQIKEHVSFTEKPSRLIIDLLLICLRINIPFFSLGRKS